MLVDQLFFAPVALSSFYVGLTVLEGKSTQEVYEEWRKKFPGTWKVRVVHEKDWKIL